MQHYTTQSTVLITPQEEIRHMQATFNAKFKEVRLAKQKDMDRIDERLGRVAEIQVCVFICMSWDFRLFKSVPSIDRMSWSRRLLACQLMSPITHGEPWRNQGRISSKCKIMRSKVRPPKGSGKRVMFWKV